MVSTELVFAAFLWTALSSGGVFNDLVPLGEDRLAHIMLDERLEITLIEPDEPGTVTRKRLSLPENLGISLSRTKMTPNGEVVVPSLRLLALTDRAFFFHAAAREVLGIDGSAGSISRDRLYLPRIPGSAHPHETGWVIAASMVVTPSCSDGCDCAYFHIVDEAWQPRTCFGRGKSFAEGFMKGDIPKTAWWSERKLGVIYYSRTRDLYLCHPDGGEELLHTELEKPIPGGRLELSTVGDGLFATSTSDRAVVAHRLDGYVWREIATHTGDWELAVVMAGFVVMVDEEGRIECRKLSEEKS